MVTWREVTPRSTWRGWRRAEGIGRKRGDDYITLIDLYIRTISAATVEKPFEDPSGAFCTFPVIDADIAKITSKDKSMALVADHMFNLIIEGGTVLLEIYRTIKKMDGCTTRSSNNASNIM